jgi:hypothetical protein
LNAFVSEEKANRINTSERTLENEEYWEFTRAMFGLEIREEMDEFISEVQGLDADDPLFCRWRERRLLRLAGYARNTSDARSGVRRELRMEPNSHSAGRITPRVLLPMESIPRFRHRSGQHVA